MAPALSYPAGRHGVASVSTLKANAYRGLGFVRCNRFLWDMRSRFGFGGSVRSHLGFVGNCDMPPALSSAYRVWFGGSVRSRFSFV